MSYILPTLRAARRPLRREIADWQRGALGLLALSIAANAGLYGLLGRERAGAAELREQVRQAEHIRDMAVQELGEVSLASAKEQQARAEQVAAYEAIGAWEYLGEFTLTAYCPCELCCGQWADGLTATGLPASQGVVAVDPAVIPLGSTVILDGQRYLAADTGVTGQAVDLCMEEHEAAQAFGVRTAEVWVIPAEKEEHHD